MKKQRQNKLIEFITEHAVETQEDLQKALCDAGFNVTQATVSRDIKELRIVKALDSTGKYRYTVANTATPGKDVRYSEIFSNSVIKVDFAMNDVVIKCHAGMAQGACAALDNMFSDMVLGTLAGDDTILAITSSEKAAKALFEKLSEFI